MPDVFLPELLNQTATYWASSGQDGYGGRTYAAPASIACRWEECSELITDKTGLQAVAQARVWVDRDLEPDGYLLLGSSAVTDPTAVSGASEIRKWAKTPDLEGEFYERIAYL